ncbi:peroxiredoxin family protein [Methylocapsa aurea]|uniref:peroxiredoxin family protein n=1 Tax=Methylocapsa aurea TaxID=663610 RepID=UPI000565548C|nr:redoxin domain-containing protein [Methylocapsa aurea]
MPPFFCPDQSGRLVTLEDLTGVGRTILSFHCGHLRPIRQIELHGLIEAKPAFASLQATVVSIIPEPQTWTGPLAHDLDEELILLSDVDNAFAFSTGSFIGSATMPLT